VLQRHHRAVVLGEERLGLDPGGGERGGQSLGEPLRGARQRRVEDRRVLALQQAQGADLVAERDGHGAAELAPHHLLRGQLVLERDR
jgi:hypothetical protein